MTTTQLQDELTAARFIKTALEYALTQNHCASNIRRIRERLAAKQIEIANLENKIATLEGGLENDSIDDIHAAL